MSLDNDGKETSNYFVVLPENIGYSFTHLYKAACQNTNGQNS